MPRKTVRPNADPERDYTVKVDFYRCPDREDGVSFADTLGKALALPQGKRTLTVGKEQIILVALSQSQHRYKGEIARLRMTEIPVLGDLNGHVEDLQLRADQGVAERTAFLYDSKTKVLAIHAVREAVSAGRLAGYCDAVEATEDSFSLEPIVRVNTLSEFNHLESVRKVEVRISSISGAASAPAPDRSSVRNYLRFREFAALGAETMSITLGMGTTKRNAGMIRDEAGKLVRALLGHKDSLQVETLRIGGKEPDDEAVVLDLLHGRLRHEVEIKVRGRSASYNKRAEAVEVAYDANESLFLKK